jgi:hypothetical protein
VVSDSNNFGAFSKGSIEISHIDKQNIQLFNDFEIAYEKEWVTKTKTLFGLD